MKGGGGMGVRKVFWEDPYLTSLEAQITSVRDDTVTLDRTVAFAFSGGQASDSGSIGGRNILEANLADGEIFYRLDATSGLSAGDRVTVEIDWTKRYRIMRLHFAAELILELVNQHFGRPEKIGANISEEKARVDFLWTGSIAETFPILSAKISELVQADLPIVSAFEDAEAELRFWEIAGFAKVPCGGTHLRRTGEIGGIGLKRCNIGKGKERIEITLRDS